MDINFWQLDIIVFVAELEKSLSLFRESSVRVPCNLFGASRKGKRNFLAFYFFLSFFSFSFFFPSFILGPFFFSMGGAGVVCQLP